MEIYTGEIDNNGNPILVSLPLCNPTNNISHCQSLPLIAGKMFYDNNSNGTHDVDEPYKANNKTELSNLKN